MAHRLSVENIRRAAGSIDPAFRNTPQFEADRLSAVLGCRLIVKVETINPIRCFKGRGADNFVSSTDPALSLVCASAGNFGQAMAYACRRRGLRLTVFAAGTANPYKLERMAALGANLVLRGEDFDAAKLEARKYVEETPGTRHVEDGLEPAIAEGAGTIGVELSALSPPLEAAVIPVGNGALIGGIGAWLKHTSPQTRIVAVQAAGAPAMVESWRSGCVRRYPSISTIADGLGVRIPIPEAVADMRAVVDEALLVEDARLIEAMKLAHRELGLELEPSGAAGIAAILAAPERFAGRTVATVLCGSNLTAEQSRRWLYS